MVSACQKQVGQDTAHTLRRAQEAQSRDTYLSKLQNKTWSLEVLAMKNHDCLWIDYVDYTRPRIRR